MSEQRAKAKRRVHGRTWCANMPEEDPDFQIAPMIDVLLVLLVFFMSISSTEVLQSTKNIELPIAADGNAASKNKGQVIVNISWLAANDVGTITVDERNYATPADLQPMLLRARQDESRAAGADPRGQADALRFYPGGDDRRRRSADQERDLFGGGQGSRPRVADPPPRASDLSSTSFTFSFYGWFRRLRRRRHRIPNRAHGGRGLRPDALLHGLRRDASGRERN